MGASANTTRGRLNSRSAGVLALIGLGWVALAVGCASGSGSDTASGSGGPAGGAFAAFPATLSARWTPPPFATRSVDGEQAVVVAACVEAAKTLGYTVIRLDAATGKLSAARRQTTAFDGARQDTLELTVSSLAPEISRVATVLRETVETGGDAGHAGGGVTTGLVRDRASYDVFFARLAVEMQSKAE